MENNMEVPQIKNSTAMWSSNFTSGYLPKEVKLVKFYQTLIGKDICTPMFIAALFRTPNIWEQPKCPLINEPMKEVWYMYNGISFSHKKWNLVICDNMDGSRVYYSNWNKSNRDKCHMNSLICSVWKTKRTKWKQTQIQRTNGWLPDWGWEVQNSSYKINKSQGCNVQHKEYGQ